MLSDKKILIMGRKKAGKTSIHAILFSDFSVYQTKSMPFTSDINECNVEFLNHKLRIDDCGGQDDLINYYIKEVPDKVFSNVHYLIYIFDIQFEDEKKDLETYKEILDELFKYSKNAKVFILLHKMDLIEEKEKDFTFKKYSSKILDLTVYKNQLIKIFATTIWDASLYTAWSYIIQIIIPDIKLFNDKLKFVSDIIECDEVILLEKSTLLKIGSYNRSVEETDYNKYDNLSQIVKFFKVGCSKNGKDIGCIHVSNKDFTVVFENFTDNTFILVLFFNRKVEISLVSVNLKLAKKYFKSLETGEMDFGVKS